MVKLNLKIPNNFYNEETRNNYLVSTNMKKVWSVELDLLDQLDKICKKNNLTYYADSGTLLGAVRHHGFIPWDDDMDFVMFREDFEKLCDLSSEFKTPYFLQTEETDPGSLRCHAQLRNSDTTGILKSEINMRYPFNQGIFIDIFPLDSVPENKDKRLRFMKELYHLKKKARWYYDYNHNIVKKEKITNFHSFLKQTLNPVLKAYFNLLERKYGDTNPYYVKFIKKAIKYDNDKTRFVNDIVLGPVNYVLYREDFSSITYLPFEMIKVPVPKNYNRILQEQYGNWHVMVKGKNAHGGCLFDTEKSYKEYI